MDVRSRFTKSAAALVALAVFAGIAGVLEMNWREKIIAPAIRGAAKAFGLSELARAFVTGQDAGEGGRAGLSSASAYAKSAWVMSAVSHVVDPIKAVALKFYDAKENEIQDEALAAFWRRPAIGLSYEEFIDATARWHELAGEFFWLLDDSWLTRTARKTPFIVARPRDMREIVRGGELLGWVWTAPSGAQIPFLPEQVIQKRRWNPNSHWRGLGKLEAAMLAAQTDHAAARFAHDTFANAGTNGEYIALKGGTPTTAQLDQIKTALLEKRAAMRRGDFRPAVLFGDMEVKSPQVTSPDAAFVANRLSNRHEIYVAFGVPASMADVIASYSIGSASDLYRLIFGTSMPLAATIAGAVEQLAQAQTGRADVEAWFDFDEHPVMQAVRRERIDAADKLWTKGMPMRAISDYLDMGLPRFAGDDVGYLPFSVAPIGEGMEGPETTPAATEEEPADPIAAMIKVLERRPAAKALPTCTKARDPRRLRLAQQHAAARRGTEKAFLAKIKKTLMGARSEVLRRLEAAKTKGVAKAAAADLNFDLNKFREGLKAEMRKQSRAALIEAGQALFDEVAKDDTFAMAPHAALRFLATRENRIADAAEEVHAAIEATLAEGLDAGDTMDELADRVRAEFGGIERGRAVTIATTETGAAYGVARHDAMEQAGIQFKQWLTAADDHVRDSHADIEGEIVALHENFSIGLAFPGDPEGPAEEVINCRCVQIPVSGPEEENA